MRRLPGYVTVHPGHPSRLPPNRVASARSWELGVVPLAAAEEQVPRPVNLEGRRLHLGSLQSAELHRGLGWLAGLYYCQC